MNDGFRLTGKHVLAALLGFFLIVLMANVIFINLAIRTFPGEKEEKSYLQGLNYNDRLIARAEQARLGWQATIQKAEIDGDGVTVDITITDKAGSPLSHLQIDGVVARPAADNQDHAITFNRLGNGRYAATFPGDAGLWVLEAVAVDRTGRQFDFGSRLEVE